MASAVDSTTNGNQFNNDFEEYRRACRERYQNSIPPVIEEDEVIDVAEECTTALDSMDITSASIDSRIFSVTPASPPTTTPALNNSTDGVVRLNASVEALKKPIRRNSLDKVISFCSSVFSKKPDSPQTIREKEKTKAEREKQEQDFRMARFIAELQMTGRSDEEIQMHLFHIRDQAQFRRPRSNSVTEMFRSMHQAFKDEFAARRDRNVVTVHVSTENPFFAAPPPGYSNDLGYSYEDLVALEPVPRGVGSLDHLPVISYSGQELKSEQTSCAICMGEFEMNDSLRALPCEHHFHQDCVDKWLTVGHTCPVCKGEVRQ